MVKSVITTAHTHAGTPVRVEFAPIDGPKGRQVRIRTAEEVLYIDRDAMADIVIALFGNSADDYQPRHEVQA